MAIGEFGGAPAAAGRMLARCLRRRMYWLYEMSHAALDPARALCRRHPPVLPKPGQPAGPHDVRQVDGGGERNVRALDPPLRQAGLEHRRRPWSAASTFRCTSRTVWERPFCRLLHFERAFEHPPRRPQPRLLIVAPMSGHYATLLRGTVEAFLPNHDVYITEWVDARMVPVSEGRFDLDDYIDYLISMLHLLGGDTHVIAVCQPSVPVLAAVALMEADERSLCAAFHDADGRPDRHPRQSDRASTSWPRSAASTGSAATSSPRCRSRIRASCATSIRASCSSTAS